MQLGLALFQNMNISKDQTGDPPEPDGSPWQYKNSSDWHYMKNRFSKFWAVSSIYVLKKSVFRAKLFLGEHFTKVICTFLKSVWKDGFFDIPFDLIKEKQFSSHNRVSVDFWWTKKSKNGSNHSIFRKTGLRI
jgi:hypothetical protein